MLGGGLLLLHLYWKPKMLQTIVLTTLLMHAYGQSTLDYTYTYTKFK